MKVIEIGDLRTANGVKCGIVIEAQKEELQEIAGKILYREVTVEPIKESPEEIWNKKMEEMCEKLIEIDQRLREQKNTKKYTRDEVLAMLDEIVIRANTEKPMSYKVHLDTCPFCGMEDTAQLIPHGIGIAKFFIVRCVVKRGGCGASVTGKTRRLAEKAWNRNPPDTQEEGVEK